MSGHTDDIGDPTAQGWFSWDDEAQPDVCPECGEETTMQSSEDCMREIYMRGSAKDNIYSDDEDEKELTDREKELVRLIELQERLIEVITEPAKLALARTVLSGLVKEFNNI